MALKLSKCRYVVALKITLKWLENQWRNQSKARGRALKNFFLSNVT